MAENLKMQSDDIVGENISFIESRWPNVVKETKDENGKLVKRIDFDALKQELSREVITDKQERYQMTWPDKKKAVLAANSSINATLRPLPEKSVDFDNTQNLYIEGDNLDVLKLLRETYLNKVSVIYIDPPYNTGNDFVYNDDFSENTNEYLARSGQYDNQGNRLVFNTESNGRFHSDWLNMIYPRLKIAKDLLTEDGLIFISIGDDEIVNLTKICDEIFGSQNQLAKLIVVSAPAGTQSAVDFSVQQSYCLVYRKSDLAKIEPIPLTQEEIKTKYNYGQDEKGSYYIERIWKRGAGGRKEDVPSLHFPVYYDEKNNKIYIDQEANSLEKNNLIKIIPYQTAGVLGRWTWSREKMIKDRDYLIVAKVAGEYKLHKKMYASEDTGKMPYTIIDSKLGRTELGSLEIKNLFDGEKVFDYPKYSAFVEYLINLHPNKNGTVLDFFSGSASTAQAVIHSNSLLGTHRKFILVQLPEKVAEESDANKLGYKNICDIGEERIRRAGKKIKDENPLTITDLDIGFRVLKLDSSNMKDVYYSPKQVQQLFLDDLVDNVKDDRTSLDLLFQVMLDLGIELSAKITEKTIDGKQVFVINESYLVACFASNISEEVVRECAKISPVYVVFRDASFNNDSSNINCEQIIKTISPSTELKVI